MYNNESYLPYLVSLINEKNKFIEELKISLISFNSKFTDAEQVHQREIDILKNNIIKRDDKIKASTANDKFELVDYYETEIKEINNKFDNFYNIIRLSLENVNPSIGLNEKKNKVNFRYYLGSL